MKKSAPAPAEPAAAPARVNWKIKFEDAELEIKKLGDENTFLKMQVEDLQRDLAAKTQPAKTTNGTRQYTAAELNALPDDKRMLDGKGREYRPHIENGKRTQRWQRDDRLIFVSDLIWIKLYDPDTAVAAPA